MPKVRLPKGTRGEIKEIARLRHQPVAAVLQSFVDEFQCHLESVVSAALDRERRAV